ncbi:hypothetical protein Droror1_Dr00021643 [Drosera rotundifolia]
MLFLTGVYYKYVHRQEKDIKRRQPWRLISEWNQHLLEENARRWCGLWCLCKYVDRMFCKSIMGTFENGLHRLEKSTEIALRFNGERCIDFEGGYFDEFRCGELSWWWEVFCGML